MFEDRLTLDGPDLAFSDRLTLDGVDMVLEDLFTVDGPDLMFDDRFTLGGPDLMFEGRLTDGAARLAPPPLAPPLLNSAPPPPPWPPPLPWATAEGAIKARIDTKAIKRYDIFFIVASHLELDADPGSITLIGPVSREYTESLLCQKKYGYDPRQGS
jgi:hypothetical protein